MRRLIDADALIGELHNTYLYSSDARSAIYEKIGEQPTIDAVPVVRCKDCKYAYMTDDGYCNWCDIMADLLGLEYDDIHLPGDWFCADGKKVMDNEQTN